MEDEAKNIGTTANGGAGDGGSSPDRNQDDNNKSHHPHTGDGASPGKIFIGGLARETTSVQFLKHFGAYGEITDSVIMKDRNTGHPRGFGFVTYADPSVVDKVIEDSHIINGKQVEIKRTIPRGAAGSKDFRTKKIFVGGIPTTVTEDEFKDFFSKFGEISEHQIMRDHSSGRSRGFGFISFDTEQAVEDLLVNGNKIEFSGTQVEIKKAEPKKPNAPPPSSKRHGNPRASFGGGFEDTYVGRGGAGFGAGPYRSGGAYGARAGAYGGYGGGADLGGYGAYGGGSLGAYRGEQPSVGGYSSRYGGGGLGRGYDIGGGYGGGLGDSYGGYGGAGAAGAGGGGGYGAGYDAGLDSGYGGGGAAGYGSGGGAGAGYGGGAGAGYGGAGAGAGAGYGGGGATGYGSGGYGGRGGYGGAGSTRYHPYGR